MGSGQRAKMNLSIRSRLIIAATAPLAITLIIGAVFYWAHGKVDDLNTNAELAESISEHLIRLDSFTQEFIQSGTARPRQQSIETFAAIPPLLDQFEHEMTLPSNGQRVREIRERLHQMASSFNAYDRLTGQSPTASRREQMTEIADRIIVDSRGIKPFARLLHVDAHASGNAFQHQTVTMAYLMLLLGTGLVLVLILPLFWRIDQGLSGLTLGASHLQQGDLKTRISLPGHDEFNALADDFNAMAHTLDETMASRAELNAEINERKKAESGLLESEARFRQLIDVAPVPMCFVSSDGTIRYLNRHFLATFGYSRDDIPTLNEWWQLAYPNPEYRDWVLTTWGDAVQRAAEREGIIEPIEYRVTRKDGTERIVEISGIPIQTDFLATFYDVTERHQILAEQEHYAEKLELEVAQRTMDLSRRTQELLAANKDLESFSYSVSHDLRAPLRAIDGFVAILLEEYATHLDAEGQRMFGIVSDNARKMGHLIDDILAFSRAGRLDLDRVPVNMQALVEDVWAGLAGLDDGHAIEFQLAPLPTAHCDPRAIRQVWQNLLANAVKFSRTREPAIIQVNASDEGDFIRYAVTDNGVGFNPEYVHKLFLLFQRLHGMDEFEGTGVGLAIVQRFVQKHGGLVSGSGHLDAGATFSFTLPKHPDLASN